MTKVVYLGDRESDRRVRPRRILSLDTPSFLEVCGLSAQAFAVAGHTVAHARLGQWSPNVNNSPEMIWITSPKSLRSVGVAYYRKRGAKIVYFARENPFSLKNRRYLPVLEACRGMVDVIVTPRRRTILDFAALGFDIVAYARPFTNPEVLLPRLIRNVEQPKIVYCGCRNATSCMVLQKIALLSGLDAELVEPGDRNAMNTMIKHAINGSIFIAMPDDREVDDLDPLLPLYINSGVRLIAEDVPGQSTLWPFCFTTCHAAADAIKVLLGRRDVRSAGLPLRADAVAAEITEVTFGER